MSRRERLRAPTSALADADQLQVRLGGVSPTIVIPGKWSAADLRFQAEHVATQKRHNNGFNCIASQVLIISSERTRIMHWSV